MIRRPCFSHQTSRPSQVFEGNTRNWKYHLSAAWKFLQHHRHTKSWDNSEDAWYVTQSFCLLRIEYETTTSAAPPSSQDDDDGHPEFPEPICLLGGDGGTTTTEEASSYGILSSNPRFGTTLGASGSIMECMSEINRLSTMTDRARFQQPVQTHATAQAMPPCLLHMLSATDEPAAPDYRPAHNNMTGTVVLERAREAHLRAFKLATLIYYYQTCEQQLSPRDLAPFVSEVLRCLSTFLACNGGGNPTLWPAFIAGVDACTARDRETVMRVFEHTSRVGMMNRVKMQTLLEQIWQIRASNALTTGQPPDTIRIDWRRVMKDMGIDILLV